MLVLLVLRDSLAPPVPQVLLEPLALPVPQEEMGRMEMLECLEWLALLALWDPLVLLAPQEEMDRWHTSPCPLE